MAETAVDIIHKGIESFINKDPETAFTIAQRDREIDDIHLQVIRELIFIMITD